jgi:hypothetical protein
MNCRTSSGLRNGRLRSAGVVALAASLVVSLFAACNQGRRGDRCNPNLVSNESCPSIQRRRVRVGSVVPGASDVRGRVLLSGEGTVHGSELRLFLRDRGRGVRLRGAGFDRRGRR